MSNLPPCLGGKEALINELIDIGSTFRDLCVDKCIKYIFFAAKA